MRSNVTINWYNFFVTNITVLNKRQSDETSYQCQRDVIRLSQVVKLFNQNIYNEFISNLNALFIYFIVKKQISRNNSVRWWQLNHNRNRIWCSEWWESRCDCLSKVFLYFVIGAYYYAKDYTFCNPLLTLCLK